MAVLTGQKRSKISRFSAAPVRVPTPCTCRPRACSLGTELARRGYGLVYGGGNVGLMGAVAEAVVAGGGSVVGVIPAALAPRELSGVSIGQVIVVDDMHARKAEMSSRADAFIAMPGGMGTWEELVEIMTWQQLAIHDKPIALLNVNGFYDHFVALIENTVNEGFIRPHHKGMLLVASDPVALLDKLPAHKAVVPYAQLNWNCK
eukprot:gnl/Hemi2/19367_TR6435_c0_g1_i1.p1 gnl/Hemi2/19367_TR6435_c0_g1~~gnl/Hemi2/19367_TR6435_c0_g1_i1.p1  ORF type:complete len:204 (-),score=40.84 gnl/Hemi2/19367_TR6435_c0_g1_i1:81-692(-)